MQSRDCLLGFGINLTDYIEKLNTFFNIVSKSRNRSSIIVNVTIIGMAYPKNYTNPGYGFSLVDTLWNAGSYRQPLEQEGNPMT